MKLHSAPLGSCFLAALLALAVSTCRAPQQQSIVVLANLIPDAGSQCAVKTPTNNDFAYRPGGDLDLNQRFDYYLFPLLENRLANTEVAPSASRATTDMRNDSNDFSVDFVWVNYNIVEGALGNGQLLPRQAYTQAFVPSGNGRLVSVIEAIPPSACSTLASMVTPTILVEVGVTYFGHTLNESPVVPRSDCGDQDFVACNAEFLHSNTFTYPLRICKPTCADACTKTCLDQQGCLDSTVVRGTPPATCGTDGVAPMCLQGQDETTYCANAGT